MKKLLLVSFMLLSLSANSNETSPTSKIKKLVSYSKYGNGDVYVLLEQSAPICSSGYYISQDRVGFKNNFSMLLAAFQAQTPIKIIGDDQNTWSGSSSYICEIYNVIYEN